MSFAFVCAKEEEDWDVPHTTVGVLKRCQRCGKDAVAGYWCDTCGYEDTDDADRLSGHGPGRCEVAT